MDPRERMSDQQVAIGAQLDGRQAQIWTCLPGIVQSFNAAKMTCEVQPAIQGQFRGTDGKWTNQTMPLLVDCPVLFPGGGGFLMTMPLAKGDEVLINFSSRCIDAWHQQGGVQPQAQFRMHDLSDGFVTPRLYSLASIPNGISTTTAQLRTLDGEAYIEMAAGHVINIVAPGGLKITANVEIDGTLSAVGTGGEMSITGNIALNGSMTATGEITAASIPLSTHLHPVPTGGNTGAPIP